MAEAMLVLGSAQDRGNPFAQAVWDALWVQWGRVDPQGALDEFAGSPNKPRSDARNVMRGWFETDPAGALAWAREPKNSWLESVAAASAIVDSVNGEPGALREAMLDLPADSSVLKECVNDYFDLVAIERNGTSPDALYDELPSTLREAAWTVTLDRLRVNDPQEAAAWLEAHVEDAGRDYRAAFRLINDLSSKDPEETAKWASSLPVAEGEHPNYHPAAVAVGHWLNENAAAASEWLAAQPPDLPWVRQWAIRLGLRAE